jgi:regulator of protease activity HflC (stomatin/prohibitin superfamily)
LYYTRLQPFRQIFAKWIMAEIWPSVVSIVLGGIVKVGLSLVALAVSAQIRSKYHRYNRGTIGYTGGTIVEGLLGLLVGGTITIVLAGFRMDREYQRGVIFRLGRIHATMGPGVYWVIPAIDQKMQIDIRTKTVNIEPQETVTADNVTIRVNAVLYYRITDPVKAVNKVENYQMAVYQIALTTLRNVVGQNALDDVLQNRDKINHKVQEIVDDITEPWGVVIERVEMKDVEIPPTMQRAMAKEAEAAREKRARLIKATAEQEASVKLAEASQLIQANPAALELRRLQMLSEVGSENNTTTIIMLPSDFLTLAQKAAAGFTPPTPPAANSQVVVEMPSTNADRQLEEIKLTDRLPE